MSFYSKSDFRLLKQYVNNELKFLSKLKLISSNFGIIRKEFVARKNIFVLIIARFP